MGERESDERSASVEKFISTLVASDSDLLPITRNECLLRTRFSRPERDGVDHCLTLLGRGSFDDGLLNPFGWIGLRITENQGTIKAFFVGTKLSYLRFPRLGLNTPFLEYDHEERIVRLKKGGYWFFAGNLNDVFRHIKVAMTVESWMRNQGWGRFLIQTAAQIALAEGSQTLGCEEDTKDTTILASRSGQSLYSRALGVEKIPTSTGGWYYPIGPQTPIDQIATSLL